MDGSSAREELNCQKLQAILHIVPRIFLCAQRGPPSYSRRFLQPVHRYIRTWLGGVEGRNTVHGAMQCNEKPLGDVDEMQYVRSRSTE
jgi:hypothetical protein